MGLYRIHLVLAENDGVVWNISERITERFPMVLAFHGPSRFVIGQSGPVPYPRNIMWEGDTSKRMNRILGSETLIAFEMRIQQHLTSSFSTQ